jgi:hypothetical protein
VGPRHRHLAHHRASALRDSRVDPRFAQVFEVSSASARATCSDRRAQRFTGRGVAFNLSYTIARNRDQSSFGFGGPAGGFSQTPTAGDPNVLGWAASDQDVRHNLIGTVTYPFTPSFEVTAITRATSGNPYTPVVQNDINGDGAAQRRGVRLRPVRVAADPALRAGWSGCWPPPPPAHASASRAQLGRVGRRATAAAARGVPGLDLQLNYKPDRLGLKRRLTLSALLINPLAGLDQALHGDDLRGWGQFVRPDPTLLAVRGFDAANRRYVYEVNERFGNVRQTAQAFRQTFQVGVQARYVYGQGGGFFGGFGGGGFGGPGGGGGRGGPGGGFGGGPGAIVIAGGPGGPGAPGAAAGDASEFAAARANPIARLIELRDSLQLDSAQVVRLEPVRDSLAARFAKLAEETRALIARQGNNPDQALVFAAIRPKLAERRTAFEAALEQARAIMTPEQWARVPEEVRNPFRGFGPGGQGGGDGPRRRPPQE